MDMKNMAELNEFWKEKSTYNILKPADGITTSENGRHGKNPYHEIEEQR